MRLTRNLVRGGAQVTKFSQIPDKIREIQTAHIYGFTVDNDNPDPATRVEYTDEAVGLEPAKMGSSSFDWGGWKDIFFNAQNHVYRIRQDGSIVGQVKDDDYSKFVDGSDSGITGAGHTDNFMSSIPTCWVYRGIEGNKRVVKIADRKVNGDYKAYAHTNESGEILDFIYWPTFRGSDVNGVMRSLSGKTLMAVSSLEKGVQAATANGLRWHVFDWADYQLRNDLLCLMFKSTDLRTSLGIGHTGGANSNTLNSGTLNTKGAFWGDQTSINEVKAFHCEAPWGNQYLRIAGCRTDGNSTLKIKMSRPYNNSGSGYTAVSPKNSSESNYMSAGVETNFGLIPTENKGSSSTYECARTYFEANANIVVGGYYFNAETFGPWSMLATNFQSKQNWVEYGSALCLK